MHSRLAGLFLATLAISAAAQAADGGITSAQLDAAAKA